MADEGTGETLANGADTAPVAGIISQYVKDYSFENPNAPAVYQQQSQPRIDVGFNIGANKLGEDVHEVALKVDIRADFEDGQVGFVIDLTYAGLFGLRNIPDEHLQPFLLGEAPRLLFPFARRLIADAVRDGGFPPLLLDPIDFNALYQQQVQQGQALAEGEPAGQA
jgi:preprotein translocase subunit SecB